MGASGVMFHHFHGGRHSVSQGSISAEELADLLHYVGVERILPAHEWAERARKGRLEEGDRCLTFDDALRCQYEVALPVLEELGLTAFWFVYSSVFAGQIERLEVYRHFRMTAYDDLDRYYADFEAACESAGFGARVAAGLEGVDTRQYKAVATYYTDGDRRFRYIRDEILTPVDYVAVMDEMLNQAGVDPSGWRELLWMDDDCLLDLHRKGHVVGLHSYTHPTAIASLDEEAQRTEYTRNVAHLEGLLGVRPTTVSHPCNSYNAETLKVLSEMGIDLGFRNNLVDVPERSGLEHPRDSHTNVLRALKAHV